MQTRTLSPTSSSKVLAVLAPGEEVVGALEQYASSAGVRAASFTGIGVFSDAEIGYLDPVRNDYDRFTITEAAEVLAFNGTIVTNHGKPEVHAHVALGMADTSVRGGHLFAAHVHPTLEVVLDVLDTDVHRTLDAATGQELIAL